MSGHNKWSTIKNKKAKTDAAKGKIFTKIGREIVIAVKTGGSADPNLNSCPAIRERVAELFTQNANAMN